MALNLFDQVLTSAVVVGLMGYVAWRLGAKPEVLLVALLTAWVTVTGWHVSNYYQGETNRKNKQREARVSYLIEAYRKIETACDRRYSREDRWGNDEGKKQEAIALGAEVKKGIESAIADVQLFGTTEQMQMANKLSEAIGQTGYYDPKDLLSNLREDLRKELDLEPVPREPVGIRHFRVKEMLPQ